MNRKIIRYILYFVKGVGGGWGEYRDGLVYVMLMVLFKLSKCFFNIIIVFSLRVFGELR